MTDKPKNVPIQEAFSFGWKKFSQDTLVWIGVVLLMGVLSSVVSYLLRDTSGVYYNNIASFLVNTLIAISVTTLALRVYNGKRAEYKDLFSNLKPYGNFLLTSILTSLLAGLSILIYAIIIAYVPISAALTFPLGLAAIITAVIILIRYQFATTSVLDHSFKPLQAMKYSAKLTDGTKGKLFVFDCLALLIIIISLIPFFLGLLVAIPVVWLAQVYVYKKLVEQAK
ncbi:MAG TPA: hypothetical protein PK263_00170 [bacterium]|nr:hypothetical protein [bacterium]